MTQIEINSLFTNGGIPATGIGSGSPSGFPSVRIWEVSGNVQTLIIGAPAGIGQNTDGIMAEIITNSPATGDGFYTFLFTDLIGYDATKKYLIRSDGGPTLPDGDRYQTASIDPIEENIIRGVWDEQLTPDHQIVGSAGLTLSQIKADTTQLFLDVASVKSIVDIILKYDTNRTKINDVNKTLTVYDDDCTTVLRVFNLLDQNGNPSTDSVCERKPVVANDGKPVCP